MRNITILRMRFMLLLRTTLDGYEQNIFPFASSTNIYVVTRCRSQTIIESLLFLPAPSNDKLRLIAENRWTKQHFRTLRAVYWFQQIVQVTLLKKWQVWQQKQLVESFVSVVTERFSDHCCVTPTQAVRLNKKVSAPLESLFTDKQVK